MKRILFDARALEHPQPLEQGVRHLAQMDHESYLHMIHRKNPLPLLQMAQERGYQTLSQQDDEGVWHILITKNPNIRLKELPDV